MRLVLLALFHEYLVTPEEIPFCHDLGDMYKISKEKSSKKLSAKEFSSETAKKMNEVKLKNVIKELREEYLPFWFYDIFWINSISESIALSFVKFFSACSLPDLAIDSHFGSSFVSKYSLNRFW